MTSYYLFGGQRVAMNKGGTLTYLHGDHLGSASIATDGGGNVIANSEMAYKPFGGVLGGGTGLDTPYRFTNQRSDESATGLYDYNARFYSPVLGRFISADSIVPGAGNPQALNRYAYVVNNPLKYKDPSGHCYGEATSANENFASCPSSTPEEIKQGARLIILGSATLLTCNFGGCNMILAGALPDLAGSLRNRLVATDYDWAWSFQDMLTIDTLDALLASGVSNAVQGGTTKGITKNYKELGDDIMASIAGMLTGLATACTFSKCVEQSPGYPDGYYSVAEEGFLVAASGNKTSAAMGFMLDKTFIGNLKFRADFLSNTAARFVTGLITDQNAVIEIRERYRHEKQFPAIVTLFHNQSAIHSPLAGPQ